MKAKSIFPDRESWSKFNEAWKAFVNSDEAKKMKLTPEYYMFYNAVMGKNTLRGFTPVTNKVKLANGQVPFAAYTSAYDDVLNLLGAEAKVLNNPYYAKEAEVFFRPFRDSVSNEHIAALYGTLKDMKGQAFDSLADEHEKAKKLAQELNAIRSEILKANRAAWIEKRKVPA